MLAIGEANTHRKYRDGSENENECFVYRERERETDLLPWKKRIREDRNNQNLPTIEEGKDDLLHMKMQSQNTHHHP